MTHESSGSEQDPETGGESELGPAAEITDPAEAADLLSEVRRLRRDARSARHAYWFPLVLFGLLTCAAVPLYLLTDHGAGGAFGVPTPGLTILQGRFFRSGSFLGYYWLVALLGGLALTLLWYRRHARLVGLKTPARGYVITTGVLTGLALFVPLIAQIPGLSFVWVLMFGAVRGAVPFLIIAVGLCVLAWAERSRALGIVAILYTGTALLASLYNIENVLFRLGWNPSRGYAQLRILPNVLLPALVLLIAGGAAFLVQRRQRSVV